MTIDFEETDEAPRPSYLTTFLLSLSAGFIVAALVDKQRAYTTNINVTVSEEPV